MLREASGQRVIHASVCISPITVSEVHGIDGTAAPTKNLFIALEFSFLIWRVKESKKLVEVIVYILKSLEANIILKYKSLT